MKSKTFKEYNHLGEVNDTLTISKDTYGNTEMRISCGRNGLVHFSNAQVKSIIKHLQELIK